MAIQIPTITTVNEYLKKKLPTYSSNPAPTTPTPPPTPSYNMNPPSTQTDALRQMSINLSKTPAPTTTVKPASPSATSTIAPPSPAVVPKPASLSTPNAQQFINTLSGTSTPAPVGAAPVSTPAPVTSPQSAYLAFLKKQFDPVVAETAKSNVDELNKRTSEEIARARTEEDTIRKNDIGQVEQGLNFSLNESARKSNRSLADIALAKGYATDIYNGMLADGKTVYEAEQAAQKEFDTRAATILEQTAPALAAQLKSLPDKVSQDNFIRSKAAEMGVSIDQLNSSLQKALVEPSSDVSSIKEYEYAKGQGYAGSYLDFVDRKAKAGGTGSTTANLKADINADVSGLLTKWNNGFIQGNGTISSKDYKSEKAKWIQAYAGDVADPGKQFDDLFSYLADQSGYNWQKDYGVK